MKYRIVSDFATNKQVAEKLVETKIEKLRQKGWEPHGKVTIIESNGYFYITQSMIKK